MREEIVKVTALISQTMKDLVKQLKYMLINFYQITFIINIENRIKS